MPYNKDTIFDYILDNFQDIMGSSYTLSESEIEELKKINDNIKLSKLYSSNFHGLYHSQKVMLFSYILAKKMNITGDDLKILLDAAIYHDCGRWQDKEDDFHGLTSANKIESFLKESFYTKNKENIEILKAIVDAHSVDDDRMENIFYNYEIDENSKERYLILAKILKEADALDRFRFSKSSSAFINIKFLRTDFSKQLMEFAKDINKEFKSRVDSLFYNKFVRRYYGRSKDKMFFHGIGWDFSKLESILENGILSYYEAKKNDIQLSRNFKGNNNDMWISAVDSEDISKDGDALKKFISGNITFCGYVSRYYKPYKKSNPSEALDKGLPTVSGLYTDESFIFGKVDIKDIYSIILPKDAYIMKINQLNYLYCFYNHETIKNRVENYINYIENKCYVKIDRKEYQRYLDELETIQTNFASLERYSQDLKRDIILQKEEEIVGKINSLIQNWFNLAFRYYLNLDRDIMVGDIIEDILKEHKIYYEKIESDETILRFVEREKVLIK